MPITTDKGALLPMRLTSERVLTVNSGLGHQPGRRVDAQEGQAETTCRAPSRSWRFSSWRSCSPTYSPSLTRVVLCSLVLMGPSILLATGFLALSIDLAWPLPRQLIAALAGSVIGLRQGSLGRSTCGEDGGVGPPQFANRGAAGVGRGDGRLRCRVGTPLRKIRARYHRYKHT